MRPEKKDDDGFLNFTVFFIANFFLDVKSRMPINSVMRVLNFDLVVWKTKSADWQSLLLFLQLH